MALQDQPQTPPSLIDPATGQPYPFGSPQYEAAIAPWITGQIKSQAENSANARGGFYSGPAMADEIQAEQGALNQMAQQGAQQALQQQELQQQEAFQQQLQDEQNRANMAATKAAAKGQAVGGAIQGGTGALGTLGGLYLAKSMFNPANPATASAAASGRLAGEIPTGMVAVPGNPTVAADPWAEHMLAGGNSAAASPADISNIVSVDQTPEFNFVTAGPGVGAAPGAAPAPLLSAGEAAPSVSAGEAGLGALAALPAAYFGAGAGERTFGNTTADKAGAGLGGLVGGDLGFMVGGPAGAAAGAGLGSFLGPGVTQGVGSAANWLGARLGF